MPETHISPVSDGEMETPKLRETVKAVSLNHSRLHWTQNDKRSHGATAILQTYAELAIEVEYARDVDRLVLVSAHINESAPLSPNILPCLGEPLRLALLNDAYADYERRKK